MPARAFVFLTKVAKQQRHPAACCVGKGDDLLELPVGVSAFFLVFFLLDEVFDLAAVSAGVEKDAICGQAVSSCSAGFLVVAFE